MLNNKQKKNQGVSKKNRLLISVNVIGSSGPIRFVISEDELVAAVIDKVLKCYARQGRLPVLGSNLNDFLLYCPTSGSDAMSPWETIGSCGARNFILCKKPSAEKKTAVGLVPEMGRDKGSGSWKAWINKSLNLKISSH